MHNTQKAIPQDQLEHGKAYTLNGNSTIGIWNKPEEKFIISEYVLGNNFLVGLKHEYNEHPTYAITDTNIFVDISKLQTNYETSEEDENEVKIIKQLNQLMHDFNIRLRFSASLSDIQTDT